MSVQNCNTIIIVLQICNNINTFFEYYLYLPVFIFEAGRVCLVCEWNHRREVVMYERPRHMSEVRMSFNFVCNIGKPILGYIFL